MKILETICEKVITCLACNEDRTVLLYRGRIIPKYEIWWPMPLNGDRIKCEACNGTGAMTYRQAMLYNLSH